MLRSSDAAEAYLPILFDDNVDFLTFLPVLDESVLRKVLELGHAAGKKVFGPRLPRLSLASALAAGQDGFHGLDALLPPDRLWDKADAEALRPAVEALAASHKPLVPLLRASALRLEDQDGDPVSRALSGLLAPSYEAWWQAELAARRPFLSAEHRALGELVLARQAQALRDLHEAGARLVPGSGAPQPWLVPGTALLQELEQWARAGLAPDKILAHATRDAALALGLADECGTLAAGRSADLLVLDQDPETDLAHLLDPAWVIVRGQVLERAELHQRLADLAERQGALRTALARPVEVAPPPQAEEGALLLEGTVATSAFGSPVSTERYRVVRVDLETLLYTTRVLFAPTPGTGERELTLELFVRRGALEQLHATLREKAGLLEHDGLWTANTWRMQTRLDGKVVATPKPLRERPLCVDAGSVTAYLMLGQVPLSEGNSSERIPVVQLHPGFEPEPVNWSLVVDPDGNHRVRTNVGFKAFHLAATGALDFAYSQLGSGVLETRALSSSAFGGAGLPPKNAAPAPSIRDPNPAGG